MNIKKRERNLYIYIIISQTMWRVTHAAAERMNGKPARDKGINEIKLLIVIHFRDFSFHIFRENFTEVQWNARRNSMLAFRQCATQYNAMNFIVILLLLLPPFAAYLCACLRVNVHDSAGKKTFLHNIQYKLPCFNL